MQQHKLINKILKAIQDKQVKEEYGTITISLQRGIINDVKDNETRKINVEEE